MAEADNLATFCILYSLCSCMFSVSGLSRVRPFACGRHSPPSTFHPYSLSLSTTATLNNLRDSPGKPSTKRALPCDASLYSALEVGYRGQFQHLHTDWSKTPCYVFQCGNTNLARGRELPTHSLTLPSSLTFVFPVGSFTHCLPKTAAETKPTMQLFVLNAKEIAPPSVLPACFCDCLQNEP